MRPKIAMWSDYGVSRRRHWRSPSRRSNRSSIGPKILVATVVVVAAIAVYPQIVDSEWVQNVGSRVKRAAVAEVRTTKRTGLVTAVPLSPRHDATTGEAAVSMLRAEATTRIVEPPNTPSPVAAAELSANVTTPAPAGTPDARAIVDPLTKPAPAVTAVVAQRDVATAPVVKRRVVRTEHRRGPQAYAQYGGWGGWNGWPGLGSPYRF
jgi:hypothetical protein